jgi:3'(2'), 5'-bisphosphate nucleotidase
VAKSLALEAAGRLMDLRGTPLVKTRKANGSLVTNADQESDRILREGLRRAFPGHAVLSEESGFEGPHEADDVWLVDPLDGTKAYAQGAVGFSVMVGLLRRGSPYLGVVIDPVEGHIYEALRGEGAFHSRCVVAAPSPIPHQVVGDGRGKTRAHVSSRDEWPSMPIITSTGFPDKVAERLRRELPCPWLPAINSVGIKVGYLVRQIADLYINHHHVHLWDTCAPQVILEEAGGKITGLDGKPLAYALEGSFQHPSPTLATNNRRQDEFLRILQKFMPPAGPKGPREHSGPAEFPSPADQKAGPA